MNETTSELPWKVSQLQALLMLSLPLMMLSIVPGAELDLGFSLIPLTGLLLWLRAFIEGQYFDVLRFSVPVLGMTAVSAKFFGIPLDVRHVTLSTGALVLAACDRGPAVMNDPALWAAAVGILIIGFLNFNVSFALALAVALRAREVSWKARARLAAAVIGRFVRHPGEFILP